MSLPETPPLVATPAPSEPVAAAVVQADTVAAKPKAVRKPRGKIADKVDAAAAVAVPVEKPKRTTAVRKPATLKKPAQTKKDEA